MIAGAVRVGSSFVGSWLGARNDLEQGERPERRLDPRPRVLDRELREIDQRMPRLLPAPIRVVSEQG